MTLKLQNRPGFYVWCLLYYGGLVLYFFGVRFLFTESNLGVWEYALALFLFALTAVLAMRIDLLWLSYRTHVKMFSGLNRQIASGKGQFFVRVIVYYAFVLAVATVLFFLRDAVHFLVLYYGVFLAGSIAMAYFDYLFPSYGRYRRNVEAGQWGLGRLSRAA